VRYSVCARLAAELAVGIDRLSPRRLFEHTCRGDTSVHSGGLANLMDQPPVGNGSGGDAVLACTLINYRKGGANRAGKSESPLPRVTCAYRYQDMRQRC